MKRFIFVLFLFYLSLNHGNELHDPTTIIDHCNAHESFSRKQAIDCLFNVVDADNNGSLTRKELEKAEKTYLWVYERVWVHVDKLMRWCDHNNDTVIDREDMRLSEHTCMELLDTRGKKTGKLCQMKHRFCDRAKKKLKHPVY